MKSKYCLLVLVLLLVFDIKGQKSAIDRYYEELKASTTIYDTIASVLSLQIFLKKDKNVIAKPLQKSLSKKYPLWVEKETTKFEERPSAAKYAEMSKLNFGNDAISHYIHNFAYLDSIRKGTIDTLDYSLVNYIPKNKTDQLLKDFFLVWQYTNTGEKEKAVEILKNQNDDEIFPIIKINFYTNLLLAYFPHVPDELEEYYEWAVNKSVECNEFSDRALLYNLKQADLKHKGKIKEAMQFGLKYIQTALDGKNYDQAASGYLNLSSYHQEQGNTDEAYRLIAKGEELAKKHGFKETLVMADGSRAFVKMNQKEYNEASQILKKCISSEHISDFSKVLFLSNLIDCQYTLGKHDSAYHYFTKLIEVDPNDLNGYHNYAKTFVINHLINTKQFELAQTYIKDAYADAEAYNDLSSKSYILSAESDLLFALGNYKEALEKIKKHFAIEMDFRNEEKASAVTAAQMTSDFENEKKILAITAENEKLAIAAQRNNALMFGGGSLLLALLSGYFYYTVRRKNQQINAQNQELETLNNTKNTLFQIIGHDLKKPTIAFRNVSNNINYLLQKEDYKRLQALGEEVDHDAKSLYMLTDNLLNWALMQKDSIHLKIETVDVTEVVEENIKLFNNVASRKNIDIINGVKASIKALVDRNAIDTIIRNLIDNAIKFTKDGGKVEITSVEKEGMVQIEIKDSGLGFSKDAVADFNEGTHISSQKGTDDEKGSGIGLQLVKNLILKNKGTIELGDSDNGATVKIILPKAS